MTAAELQELLRRLHLADVIDASRVAFFEDALREMSGGEPTPVRTLQSDLGELATVLERLGLRAADPVEKLALFEAAYTCRRTQLDDRTRPAQKTFDLLCACVDGLLSEKRSELIMLLRNCDLDQDLSIAQDVAWPDELLLRSAGAFVYLCRRQNGWEDVRKAISEIHHLRSLQNEHEHQVIESTNTPAATAAQLLASYNLAKIVDLAASYLISGQPAGVLLQIERHSANVERVLRLAGNSQLAHIADLLAVGSEAIVRSSIWFTTRTLGDQVRRFVESISSEQRRSPILELWPSQRKALRSNLLDPAKRAIIVQMPTSSGKTLLAEFAIVQALALNAGSTVAYVVPTRALVNQMTRRLRFDLSQLEYVVEAAVPVFELDPLESALLSHQIDVLVTTPEKLDLLIRSNHPAVRTISLVVADEAHNIADGERGARLELLLATIKREQIGARFLLLTPFVPNGDQLAAWLGDDFSSTIDVHWKPSDRVAAAARIRKQRNGPFELHLLTLPSVHNTDLSAELDVDLGDLEGQPSTSKASISGAVANKFADHGGVLVLTRGRKTAEDRAQEIARQRLPMEASQFGTAVISYAKSELGEGNALPMVLERGVAFHHAGLSHDLRYLIEMLIAASEVKVVCGTTTLAQGVDFPIAAVVVESLKRPAPRNQWVELSYSEFWNVAGRAGRALQDRLGVVVFPVTANAELGEIRGFLAREGTELASALIAAFNEAANVADIFNLAFVRRHPSMSVFFQYLTHALRVAGLDAARADLEDLLRASLVYHQARGIDRRLAEGLVALATRYLDGIRGRSTGYLTLADQTGFSLSTVDYLFAVKTNQYPQFSAPTFWQDDRLFSRELTGLTDVVTALASVPELSLGRSDVGPFDPRAVAGILRDWVQGKSVAEIGAEWFTEITQDPVEREREAGRYLHSKLVGQVPWGIGALQRIALAGNDALANVAHIPSLIFYGVQTKEAVAMRMAGVPRVAAESIGANWRAAAAPTESYEGIRDWLGTLSSADWAAALPVNGPLSGRDCRLVWQALAGIGTN